MTTIYHEGSELTSVIESSYTSSFENKTDPAEFTLLDINEVINISTADTITVQENGSVEWAGIVVDTPNTKTDTKSYTVKAEQVYADLLDLNTSGRVFYNDSRSDVLESIVTEKLDNRGIELTETFSDLSNVSSDAPVFELGNFQSLRPERFGSNLAYLGFPLDLSPQTVYTATVSNIDYKGDIFQELQIEYLLNNLSSVFSIQAQYIDSDSNNYVWELGSPDGYTTDILSPTDAVDKSLNNGLDPSTDQNKLRLIINLSGKLVESRAIALDAVKVISADVKNRNTSYTTNIPTDDTKVTARYTNTVSEAVNSLYQGTDKRVVINDDTDTLTVVTKNDNESVLSIDGTAPVTDFDVQTNSNKIINNVTVQGAGDIVAKASNPTSIEEYGQKNRKIRDTSIKSQRDADRKANEIINNKSFLDTELYVTVITTDDVINASVGDEIEVDIFDVNGTATIIQKETRSDGKTDLVIEGSSRDLF